jgi:DNA-binding LacI/PurR family transcriptional regulator
MKTKKPRQSIPPIKEQVTVKDLAEKLKLHHTTVSKALRDDPKIRLATRERVRRLAERLDYHPNSIALAFKKKTTKTIGVIVPQIKNDFFSAVIGGIENIAYDAGYSLSLSQSEESLQREILNVHALVSNLAAGCILAVSQETHSASHLKILQKRGIPVVFFDRTCPDLPADQVVVDDYAGAFRAVEHLILAGRGRIAHFAGPESVSVSHERCRGYLDALKKHGLQREPGLLIRGGLLERDGAPAFRRLLSLENPPDAVFAVNDLVAVGAYPEIKKAGFRIPQDIAVAGFGDTVLSSYLDPPLTTVRQSPNRIGETAARILLKRIERRDGNAPPERIVLDTELIVRKSTDGGFPEPDPQTRSGG